VLSGGTLLVLSGGIVSGVNNSGGTVISGGGHYCQQRHDADHFGRPDQQWGHCAFGRTEIVLSGGTASGTSVLGGGTELVSSGAVTINDVLSGNDVGIYGNEIVLAASPRAPLCCTPACSPCNRRPGNRYPGLGRRPARLFRRHHHRNNVDRQRTNSIEFISNGGVASSTVASSGGIVAVLSGGMTTGTLLAGIASNGGYANEIVSSGGLALGRRS